MQPRPIDPGSAGLSQSVSQYPFMRSLTVSAVAIIERIPNVPQPLTAGILPCIVSTWRLLTLRPIGYARSLPQGWQSAPRLRISPVKPKRAMHMASKQGKHGIPCRSLSGGARSLQVMALIRAWAYFANFLPKHQDYPRLSAP